MNSRRDKNKSVKAGNRMKMSGIESSNYNEGGDNRQLRDQNLQSLLDRRKLHLVLDLDNTLIHCTTLTNRCKLALKDKGYNKVKKAVADDELHEVLGGGFVVKLRPGAREFVKKVSKMFDLSIYTKSGKAYGVEVAKLLANNDESCLFTEVTSSKNNNPKEGKKELRQVMVDERAVLIVDDRVDVWRQCDRENLIDIKPYHFFPEDIKCWQKVMGDCKGEDDDGEFGRVLNTLKAVHSRFYSDPYTSKDVRQVLKSVWSNSM